jgi:two-component system, chemotaxis family, chemotaxis protein CheY
LKRILIVDDEIQIRTLLSLTLRRAGYKVTVAADGIEAMTLCMFERFDAVLTDIDMPRMNGHELVRWIARNRPKVRCAVMSSWNLDCDECPVPGMCLFLRKPFFPRDVVAIIERMLHA